MNERERATAVADAACKNRNHTARIRHAVKAEKQAADISRHHDHCARGLRALSTYRANVDGALRSPGQRPAGASVVVPVAFVGGVTVPVVDVVDVIAVRHGDVTTTLGVPMCVSLVSRVRRGDAFVDMAVVGAVDVPVVGVVDVVAVRQGHVAAAFAVGVRVLVVLVVRSWTRHPDSFHDASQVSESPGARCRRRDPCRMSRSLPDIYPFLSN